MEQKKLSEALEVNLGAMTKAAKAEAVELRAPATREIDRLKAEAQKKERELSEALIQARRRAGETEDQLKFTESRIKALESEIEKNINEKDLVLQELKSVRADFDVAIQSREALVAEVAELRNRLK
jgi:TolA-binding protein